MIENKNENKQAVISAPEKTPRMPFKRAVVTALGGFKYAIVRLVFAAVITVFALVFFGFILAYGSVDGFSVELDKAYENGYKTVVLCRKAYEQNTVGIGTVFGTKTTTLQYSRYDYPLTAEQISLLNACTTVMPVVVQNDELSLIGKYYADTSDANGKDYINVYYGCYNNFISRIVELGDTGEADACLTPDPRLTVGCRLPQTYDEIAITDYFADMFIRFGYKDADGEGQILKIESPDDIIGKKINGLTVCGVYKTEEDTGEFKKKYDKRFNLGEEFLQTHSDIIQAVDDFVYNYMEGEHPMRYAFVRSGFMTERDDLFKEYHTHEYMVLYKLSGNKQTDKKIFDSIAYKERVDANHVDSYSVDIKTRYSGFTHAARTSFIDYDEATYYGWMSVCYDIAVVAAVVGALIFTSFLSGSRKAREGSLRTLYTLGAGKRNIVLISILQCVVAALVEFVVAISIVGIICAALNAKYYLPLFGIGAGAFFAVFGLCFAAAAVAAGIQTLKICLARK